MLAYLKQLWDSDSLSPHGICLLWRPELIWTHVAADSLIGIAYFSIPVALAYFVSHRDDIQFGWVFWAFAFFILACGTTHFLSIYTLWVPDYGFEAIVKIITAGLSVFTAIALWLLLPKLLRIPSAEALHRMNEELERQIEERNAAIAAFEAEKAERLKTEDMLRQAQKMEAVGQLTGGTAHDFNNLLTVVVGNLEKLEDKFRDDPKVARAIKGAMEGASRGAALTQKLLAFGRRQPLAPQCADVNELIANMADLMHRAVGETIAIDMQLPAGIWPVQVDCNQLENALLNLAVNARDAMPQGGRLTIQTRNVMDPLIGEGLTVRGAFTQISVVDTGEGMDADVIDRAFEPFFTTKPVGAGSGLGLSQVYGFVKQSNGYVDIESTMNSGTTIKIFLPRFAPEAETEAAAGSSNYAPTSPLGQRS